MDEAIKKIVLRLFPELTGTYHLPRFARVVAISDPLEKPELADDFRPRYAVDIEVLTPQGEVDEELPRYRCVPLPVQCAGIERGQYGFPDPGALVEVGFAYGLPDHIFIRTVLGHHQGIPGVKPGDMIWQQSETVRQKVTAKGDWLRETHGDIHDQCSTKKVNAIENQESYQNSHEKVSQHSIEEVAGKKIIEALGALKLLSGGHCNLSSVDNLNLTTATDQNQVVGRNRNTTIIDNDTANVGGDKTATVGGDRSLTIEKSDALDVGSDRTTTIGDSENHTVGSNRTLTITGSDTQQTGQRTVNVNGNHTDIATAIRNIQAQVVQMVANASVLISAPSIALIAPTIAIGAPGGPDVLQVIAALCDVVSQLASSTAEHTHGNNGAAPPSSSGDHGAQSAAVVVLKASLEGVMP